jgi:putative heme-binding domain-containing protein
MVILGGALLLGVLVWNRPAPRRGASPEPGEIPLTAADPGADEARAEETEGSAPDEWVDNLPDPSQSEAIWSLAFPGGEASAAELERQISDVSLPAEVRADALTARARAHPHEVSFARSWVNDPVPAIATAARRVLRLEPPLENPPPPEPLDPWLAVVGRGGDVAAGRRVFLSTQIGCVNCHSLGRFGRPVGPSLESMTDLPDRLAWMEAIVDPSRRVKEEYQVQRVETHSGDVIQGTHLTRSARGDVTLRGPEGELLTVPADQVSGVEPVEGSLMPEGLAETMSVGEFRDLLAFLQFQHRRP